MHIGHLRISNEIKLNIAHKLLQSVSMDKILDDIRDNATENIGRKDNINKQDIRNNILNKYKIQGIERHPNDYSSVVAWIEELRSLEFNPVIFFKQQGEMHDSLEKENLLLCLQTEFQLVMTKIMSIQYGCHTL